MYCCKQKKQPPMEVRAFSAPLASWRTLPGAFMQDVLFQQVCLVQTSEMGGQEIDKRAQ